MTGVKEETVTQTALDRQDERLTVDKGFSGFVSASLRSIRSGDLGALPVIVGLIVIAIIFQSLNSKFLSSENLVNITLESVSVGVISLGIICVLLVGEIDLSVGSVSGLAGAIMAVLFVQHGWPLPLAIALVLVTGLTIGFVYAVAYTRFGMPSFVATLAGLLAFLGLQVEVLGAEGTVNIPFDSPIVKFAQQTFLPKPVAYVVMVVAAGLYFLAKFEKLRARKAAGLSSASLGVLVAKSVALLVLLEAVTWYLNRSRGVGWSFVLFAVLVTVMNYAFTRTKWGRSVFAVGGNAEAARRMGLNVRAVYTSVFMLASLFAAVGGILAAARLGASSASSGGGDVNLNAIAAAVIGGTSLFGGRGTAYSALLGIFVITSIASGLTLLNLSSAFRFIITGLVLALAVAVDSLARKSRAAHGRT